MKTNSWAQEEITKITNKVKAEIGRIGTGIPYRSVTGRYYDQGASDISWWTNGFWGGLNWQLYSVTGDALFRETAENVEVRLDQALQEFEHLHHDVGFMWLLTSVTNYRLFKQQRSFQRSINAAVALAGRFNIDGRFLRAWNDEQTSEDCRGWVIIDSMMNVPLLFWASQELKDPRFAKIARKHADTVAKYLIRADGSSGHIAEFDYETGAFIRQLRGQGYGLDSAWSRGQGWAIYGFALCYKYTGDGRYLHIAQQCANFVIPHLVVNNYLAPIDFRGPATSEDTDASASAIIACGLLELADHVEEKGLYQEFGRRILLKLAEIADYEENTDGILNHCAVQYHEPSGKNSALVYADSFYLEGLLKLTEQDIALW